MRNPFVSGASWRSFAAFYYLPRRKLWHRNQSTQRFPTRAGPCGPTRKALSRTDLVLARKGLSIVILAEVWLPFAQIQQDCSAQQDRTIRLPVRQTTNTKGSTQSRCLISSHRA